MPKTRTSFKPGQSGNPGGRKRVPPDVILLARSVTVKAMETLIGILGRDDEPAAQVRAAEALLDRGWGRAPQTVLLQGDTTIRVVTPLTTRRVDSAAIA